MRRIVLAVVLAALWTAPAVAMVAPGPAGSAPAVATVVAEPTGSARAVRPVPGPVVRPFEAPVHEYGPGHRGAALAAAPGEAVRAALPGTVAFSGEVARRGWVTLAHPGGLDTTYGWLAEREVVRGQVVAAGEALGRLDGDRAHLHWGARLHGRYFDPLLLLGRWEARLVPLR